jgi:CRP-like cAMP-binding protein
MTRNDRLATFSKSRVFKQLSPVALEEVLDAFHVRAFQSDEHIFHEGGPAHTYFVILSGRVKILKTSEEGHEVIMHILGPGELIGALPTLGEGTYPASAVAMEEVQAGSISAKDFSALMRRHPQIALNLLRFATGVIQESHRRIQEMSTERVERRVARTLSRLSSQVGVQTEAGILLDVPLSRQDLAELTGTTLYTISRTLKAWEREGLLLAERLKLTLLDAHGIAAIGEDLPDPDDATGK